MEPDAPRATRSHLFGRLIPTGPFDPRRLHPPDRRPESTHLGRRPSSSLNIFIQSGAGCVDSQWWRNSDSPMCSGWEEGRHRQEVFNVTSSRLVVFQRLK